MYYFLFLLLSVFITSGCTTNKTTQVKLIETHADNLIPDSHEVNNNLVFMLGKQSRFEMEVQEEKQRLGQVFKVGLNEKKPSINNQYLNNQYLNNNNSTLKPIQKISFTMPVPETIWNEKKQTVEFKWKQKPHYTFDAY
ncbi:MULTISPECIES: hypothetical protein [Proteus]|uniref:hypothetical protein n=1 Tax=Proteus TaxID=583 RepID=UPI0034C64143